MKKASQQKIASQESLKILAIKESQYTKSEGEVAKTIVDAAKTLKEDAKACTGINGFQGHGTTKQGSEEQTPQLQKPR